MVTGDFMITAVAIAKQVCLYFRHSWRSTYYMLLQAYNIDSQSCLLLDGEMCERKAGTMSLRWRRNATSRIKSLGEEIQSN